MKPVLQRFLLSRWAKFIAGDPKELEETSPHRLQTYVAQLLVDWLVEALKHLNKLPQLWKKSFQLTGLLPGRKEEDEVEKKEEEISQNLEEIQSDLLKTLTETLLGSEALEGDSPDLLELEDEKDTEEKLEQEEGPETSEKQEEDKEEEGKETEEGGGQEDMETEGKDTVKEKEEDRKESEEKEEDGKEEVKKIEEDSEEEGKEVEEDRKEASKERRETRIVIGEEVGDEWKITVKSRTEGVEADGDDES